MDECLRPEGEFMSWRELNLVNVRATAEAPQVRNGI